jgi:predicted RNA binding protein YcfA (HicA-like mRNA interferase family)
LIVDVPNYEGTDAQKMWNDWSGWSLPYHLYHFTPDALVSMLESHGFKIIRTKNYHSEYIKDKLRQIPVISLFARLIAKRYSGTSFAVVAQKN